MQDSTFWRVVSVYDPDGGGGDFGYTVGLADRGFPELHVWARPTHGSDPGMDWVFSSHDQCHLLNDLARRLLNGNLEVGQTFSRTYDGGLVRVDFEVGDPVTRADVEALQVDEQTPVLPIRWSLHRPVEGRLGPVAAEHVDALRWQIGGITSALDQAAVRRLPVRWRPRPEVDLRPDQRFGPLTPLVVAVAAQVATADVDELAGFCIAAIALEGSHGRGIGHVLVKAEARPVGRSKAVRRVGEAAEEIARIVAASPQQSTGPSRALAAKVFGDDRSADSPRLVESLSGLLTDAIVALLAFQVIADIGSPQARRACLGPWTWGRTNLVVAPDPMLRAHRDVLARVRTLLGPLGFDQFHKLGAARDAAARSELSGTGVSSATGRGYAESEHWIRGVAIGEGVGMPPPDQWLLGTDAGWTLLFLADRDPDALESILLALSVVTSAVAVADQVPADVLAPLISPYLEILPGLAAEVASRAAA